MKRDDILKALECCKDRRCDLCDRRYGYHAEESICRLDLIEHAHHLIGCQTKEIDRLNVDVASLERGLKEAKERAEAAPVVHGKWEFISLDGSLWCSCCKRPSGHGRQAENKYCRNCGAKMDGGTP